MYVFVLCETAGALREMTGQERRNNAHWPKDAKRSIGGIIPINGMERYF